MGNQRTLQANYFRANLHSWTDLCQAQEEAEFKYQSLGDLLLDSVQDLPNSIHSLYRAKLTILLGEKFWNSSAGAT